MIIETSAPTRIDLAGGTIDIWPLYLFHENAVTVKLAVELRARVRLRLRAPADRSVKIRSVDRGQETEGASLEGLSPSSWLALPARVAGYFTRGEGFDLEIACDAPAGAGLAGSSALNIALCGAFARLAGHALEPAEMIGVARNLEAQVIRVPTGDQDYYPAVHGGLNAVRLGVGGVDREAIPFDGEALETRLVLCYAGEPRDSGINNWEVMKDHIDGDPSVFELFETIRSCGFEMRSALLDGDFQTAASTMNREWVARKAHWRGFSTDRIDRLMTVARDAGAEAGKVCGAGGGGCICFLAGPGRKERVESALEEAGARVLPVVVAREGLSVAETAGT